METKAKVREDMLAQRYKLSPAQAREKSSRITKKVISCGVLSGVSNVALYTSSKGEAQTKALIDYLVETRASVYLPKFLEEQKIYVMVKFAGWDNLEKGPFGILQPKGDGIVAVKSIDLVFLPGVAFDKKGNRLGWGKGVYDRLFEASNATLVGLAYEFQVVDELPRENHDLTMDFVVTDGKVYRFSQQE